MRDLLRVCLLLAFPAIAVAQMQMPGDVRVYPVDKTVAEMPAGDDFSKPERAYATVNRHLAAGTADWRALSVARIAAKAPAADDKPKPVSDRAAQGWLNARIIEVRLISDTIAYVIAQWPQSGAFDVRGFELEGGRWLSVSNKLADRIDDARRLVDSAASERRLASRFRRRTTLPKEYLGPFVEYLKSAGKEPRELIIEKLAAHKLVMIGEIHHRPTYWALNCDVVRDPRFVEHVGVIYLELPSNNQALIEKFLAAETLDPSPVVETLRDMLWMGWPDQPMLDFMVAVWKANQPLPTAKRIRVVLVDAPRPWKLIRERADIAQYEVDRDQLMAANIVEDLKRLEHDGRHALFIAGHMHVAEDLKLLPNETPLKTAGWRLARELGDKCYAFIQHGPQMSNMGHVSGRRARGLFDSAFKEIGYRSVAFALKQTPFGGEPFDASTDINSIGAYQDAADGYIFLERLEDEWFSPLIDGFYTDEFVRELDRRHRVLNNAGLEQGIGLSEVTADAFYKWMSNSWGQPRDWRERLGSVDAWQRSTDEMPP